MLNMRSFDADTIYTMPTRRPYRSYRMATILNIYLDNIKSQTAHSPQA